MTYPKTTGGRLRLAVHFLTALPPWTGYVIATAAVAGTLLARLSLGHAPGDPPTLVLFIIPIVLSSYIGGLGPGLLATAISGLASAYFLLPPFYSFAIADPKNKIQLYGLLLAGTLVSMLVEKLRRTKRILEAEIVKRIRSEEALTESEERFRQAFEQEAMGIFHVGAEGLLRRVNQKFCDFTGYTREELATMTSKDLVHPEDVAEIEEIRKKLLPGELPSVVIQKRYRRKDGSYVRGSCVLTAQSPAARDNE
ncbi:MAG: DUF4118 domain-containing protein [Desulfovibrionaceae bacterium]|nr:DUF4118 domain-containing protein [Desulfovibrionaceae bacterium]MBF0512897.1 DUF4118 domain-containing protein [Desulfovibrionaceae bacterium]